MNLRAPLFAALFASLACTSSSFAETPPQITAPPTAPKFHWQRKLDAPAKVVVSNMNGRIEARAVEGDVVSFDVTKTGSPKDIALVDIVAREEGGTIYLCAVWPGQTGCPATGSVDSPRNDSNVEIVVKLPAKITRLDAQTLNGGVVVSGVAAPVNVSTKNGAIEVRDAGGAVAASTLNGAITARLAAKPSQVELKTKNGRVELTLPANADADVDASTLNGSITTATGEVVRRHGRNAKQFRIGSGGPKVDLATLNGAVVIRTAG